MAFTSYSKKKKKKNTMRAEIWLYKPNPEPIWEEKIMRRKRMLSKKITVRYFGESEMQNPKLKMGDSPTRLGMESDIRA